MGRCLRIAGVLLLVGGVCAAQIGPPACPVKPGEPPVELQRWRYVRLRNKSKLRQRLPRRIRR